ncbi:FAD/NAD-binding domain-containing protein [Schizopora paradoxa]|uniref:FAD/NAD-binding domain-containing protein n=1 Tax=Schizopora paradoxa TaxID=27342 RepID=A0A0H2RLX0_9AGAM|nr:FAD/NAD-binding domain-containing protein [Schizopora paradoxa]
MSAISNSEASPIRVAVVGGGIAGITLAIALAQASTTKSMSVHLYEAAPHFTETGAGIGMFRRPWQVMKRLNLGEEIKTVANIPDDEDSLNLAFRMSKSDEPRSTQEFDMFIPFGNITMHRVEFQNALAHHLEHEAITTHFGKRLLEYTLEANGGILLHFRDGSTEQYDVLIGADGIHSATRQSMIQLAINDAQAAGNTDLVKDLSRPGIKDPVWSGSVAYRSLIPSDKLRELNPNHATLTAPVNYMGKDKHIIAFPVSLGKSVNFVGFVSQPEMEGTVWEGKTVVQRTHEDVAKAYEGWEEEVEQLVKLIDSPSMWAINTLKALPIASHGPVAIIGDAAHAMTPNQGSGAGQAIEDAYVLAALLTHPSVTRDSIPRALKIYEKIRLPHGNDVQRRSRENGKLYEFAADERFPHLSTVSTTTAGATATDTSETDVRGIDANRLVKEIGEAAVENWKWAWTTDVETDKMEAIRMLEEGEEA